MKTHRKISCNFLKNNINFHPLFTYFSQLRCKIIFVIFEKERGNNMFTTRIYNLQKQNPSTFVVMLSKRDRRKVSGYIKDVTAMLMEDNKEAYANISRKLEKGHFSYSDNELQVMRAAITLNKYIEPFSYFCKRYALKAYR